MAPEFVMKDPKKAEDVLAETFGYINENEDNIPHILKDKNQQATFRKLRQIIRGSLNKFPDFFRMGTFIDSTHMKF